MLNPFPYPIKLLTCSQSDNLYNWEPVSRQDVSTLLSDDEMSMLLFIYLNIPYLGVKNNGTGLCVCFLQFSNFYLISVTDKSRTSDYDLAVQPP